jgi:uncharacterized protein YcbK (DUF882 family)
MRTNLLIGVIGVIAASGCAHQPTPDGNAPAPQPAPQPAPVQVSNDAPAAPAAETAAWAQALAPLRFLNTRTGADCYARVYRADGSLDEVAASMIDAALAERDVAPRPLNRRLFKLVTKAAAHFGAGQVSVVSSLRDDARDGSRHRSGEAIDFRLPGVQPQALAAYLRTNARVGVGVYTHKRTQFVHLDVREQSYSWVDASPPGVSWRETRLSDRGAPARDAAYRPEQDLPGA